MDNPKDDRYYLDKILTDLRFIIARTTTAAWIWESFTTR